MIWIDIRDSRPPSFQKQADFAKIGVFGFIFENVYFLPILITFVYLFPLLNFFFSQDIATIIFYITSRKLQTVKLVQEEPIDIVDILRSYARHSSLIILSFQ